jgi:hypothetical protein
MLVEELDAMAVTPAVDSVIALHLEQKPATLKLLTPTQVGLIAEPATKSTQPTPKMTGPWKQPTLLPWKHQVQCMMVEWATFAQIAINPGPPSQPRQMVKLRYQARIGVHTMDLLLQ